MPKGLRSGARDACGACQGQGAFLKGAQEGSFRGIFPAAGTAAGVPAGGGDDTSFDVQAHTVDAAPGEITLRVNPDLGKVLKSRDNSYLEELETILGRSVLVKSDPQLHQEKFDFN